MYSRGQNVIKANHWDNCVPGTPYNMKSDVAKFAICTELFKAMFKK